MSETTSELSNFLVLLREPFVLLVGFAALFRIHGCDQLPSALPQIRTGAFKVSGEALAAGLVDKLSTQETGG